MLQTCTRQLGLRAEGEEVPPGPHSTVALPTSSQDIFFGPLDPQALGEGVFWEGVWAIAEESFGGRVLSHSERNHCHSHPPALEGPPGISKRYLSPRGGDA